MCSARACVCTCVGGANTKSCEYSLCARHSAGLSESHCQKVDQHHFSNRKTEALRGSEVTELVKEERTGSGLRSWRSSAGPPLQGCCGYAGGGSPISPTISPNKLGVYSESEMERLGWAWHMGLGETDYPHSSPSLLPSALSIPSFLSQPAASQP